MPLNLTTAINTGDLDVYNYDYVKITSFRLDSQGGFINFTTAEGYIDGGVFILGTRGTIKHWEILGSDYIEMVTTAKPTSVDELLYNEVAKILYQWLIDEEHYAGIIV